MKRSKNISYLVDYSIAKRLGLDDLTLIENKPVIDAMFGTLYTSMELKIYQKLKIRLKQDIRNEAI